VSHDEDAVFARALAERAGALLLERYERVETIDYKSARDVVTEVDHLSEALLIGAIRERSPGDGILAEESGAHHGSGAPAEGSGANPVSKPDPKSVAEATARALAHGRTWILDPLDGTVNYANGIPYFCVSVALVEDGRPVVGVIVDPMRSETFWATADGPAMLGDREIHASRKTALTDCVVSLALAGRAVVTRARAGRTVADGVPIPQQDVEELRWPGTDRARWHAFCDEWGLDKLRDRPHRWLG
jgi:myo-inositol-1(or 4)-monophosphatase